MRSIKYLFTYGSGTIGRRDSVETSPTMLVLLSDNVRVSIERVVVSEFIKFEILVSACCLTTISCKNTGEVLQTKHCIESGTNNLQQHALNLKYK